MKEKDYFLKVINKNREKLWNYQNHFLQQFVKAIRDFRKKLFLQHLQIEILNQILWFPFSKNDVKLF